MCSRHELPNIGEIEILCDQKASVTLGLSQTISSDLPLTPSSSTVSASWPREERIPTSEEGRFSSSLTFTRQPEPAATEDPPPQRKRRRQ